MTQTTRDNGHRPPSRPTLDPDRVPSDPTTEGFWPAPISVCGRCSAMIPATETARRKHRQHHETIEAALPR